MRDRRAKQIAVFLKLMIGGIDALAAEKAGQAGLEAEKSGHPAGVDGKATLATTLWHEFDADAAVRPLDQQFAELLEVSSSG
jgi:hypothetical protein